MTKQIDMYDYILQSNEAVENIVKHQDAIFMQALAYCKDKQIEQVYILGSGTSYHAAVAAKRLFEEVTQRKVITMYPMEFVDNEKIFNKKTLVIGISHAGRSSSTIKALDKAKKLGLMSIAMTAEKDRPVSDHADCNVMIEIGVELVGPKTKGFIGSIATIALFAIKLAKQEGLLDDKNKEQLEARMLATTYNIPDIAAKAWTWYKQNQEDLLKCRRMIIIGYDNCMSAMLEGTLKILEAVRYSVVGYELEEFMHGVYHSIDSDTYLIYIGSKGNHYSRMINMLKYFKDERNAHNYLITFDQNTDIEKAFVYPFINDDYFASMEYVIALQVIARKLSFDLGIDCNIPSDPLFHNKMKSYDF